MEKPSWRPAFFREDSLEPGSAYLSQALGMRKKRVGGGTEQSLV